MNYLLAALNAKYIHSNLGIYSLRAYALETHPERKKGRVELGEYTINHSVETIIEKIDRAQPDVLGLSCYIWNISWVRELLRDLPKIRPQMKLFLGGPEASYDAKALMEEFPCLSGIMVGEGEETFSLLMDACERVEEALAGDCEPAGKESAEVCELDGKETAGVCEKEGKEKSEIWNLYMEKVPGLVWRSLPDQSENETPLEQISTIRTNLPGPLLSMDAIPFSYRDTADFKNRIIYYESSRGCPFSCSYCLSSIDKTVRFRSLPLVKQELQFFLDRQVPQVKFVDRTFNCNREHACEIWQFIAEHDNGITNFHFEIAADLLTEPELKILRTMRPGLIQLEIGVQTVNQKTIKAIRRKMDLNKVEQMTASVHSMGNIHQHLDLIAGLPYEDFNSFRTSFDCVYRMKPDQLQLGFLKVLKGSYMEESKEDCGLAFTSAPPYEVLRTNWISYRELRRLKAVEEMVEIHYNSGQFTETLGLLEKEYERPFALFEALADWYEAHELAGLGQSRLARYEFLYNFAAESFPEKKEKFRDSLCTDLYLRENAKSRPAFLNTRSAMTQSAQKSDPGSAQKSDSDCQKELLRQFYRREALEHRYLTTGYEGRDSRQLSTMTHMERLSDGHYLLFDYANRDPLNNNARVFSLLPEELPGGERHD